jgi:hypothetical protein
VRRARNRRYCPDTTELSIVAKIYAESFPRPLTLNALAKVEVTQHKIALSELIPNWEERLKEEDAPPIAIKDFDLLPDSLTKVE